MLTNQSRCSQGRGQMIGTETQTQGANQSARATAIEQSRRFYPPSEMRWFLDPRPAVAGA